MTTKKVITVIKGPILDTLLGRTISKKLIVFSIGTIGWFRGILTGTEWLILSGIYLFGLIYLNHLDKVSKLKSSIISEAFINSEDPLKSQS